MIFDFSFEQVMRLSSIKRWGIIEMSRRQSVAEHSYNVAMIAAMIVDNLPDYSKPFGIREQAVNWALVHDLPELVTGDIPTPVKSHIGTEINLMEEKLFPKLMTHKEATGQTALAIVKLADLIEAIQFAQKFCVDSRKDEIVDEMKDMVNLLIAEFAPLIHDKYMSMAVNEIWKDMKTPSKNI